MHRLLSLRWVMVGSVLIGVMLATGLAYIDQSRFLQRQYTESVRIEGERLAQLTVLALREPLWQFVPEQAHSIVDALFVNPSVARVTVVDHSHRIFVARRSEGYAEAARMPDGLVSHSSPIVREGVKLGELTLELATTGYLEQLTAVRVEYVKGAALTMFIAAVIIVITLGRTVAYPIDTLVRASDDIAAGRLDRPVPELRLSEFSSLARSLNSTRESLMRLFEEVNRRNLELTEANHQLEIRVDERTRALRQTLHDLQRTQEEVIQSERLASLGRVVAAMAHELNTPIGNAKIVASTMHEQMRTLLNELSSGAPRRSVIEQSAQTCRDGLDLFLRSIERAADLISNFKQVAIDQTSDIRRRFDLGEVTREVVSMLDPTVRRAGCGVDVQCTPELICDGFPGSFGQILTNLIMNALTHGYEDGTPGGRIEVSCHLASRERALLKVRDFGKGMHPEVMQRVFDPFFTTRLGRGGSGLGMNIVHRLVVRDLGGVVTLWSQPGEGTEVMVEFPLSAPARSTATSTGETERVDSQVNQTDTVD